MPIYTVVGSLWLCAFHVIRRWIDHGELLLTGNDIYENLVFILPTSAILCLFVRRYARQLEASKEARASLMRSEEQYRSVVEDQTELICRIKHDGTFTFVNDVYCRYFGKTREELLGRKWHPVVFPDDLPLIEEQLCMLLPSNPVVVIENRVYSGSGAIRWMEFVNRGFFDKEGRLVETQAVGRDITSRKETENALRTSDERLSLALAASKMGVWEWDLHSDTVHWSPECHEIVGLKEFNGDFKTFAELLHPDDVVHVMATVDRALAQRDTYADVFRIIRPDGEQRWLSNLGRATYDSNGVALKLTGTVRDITELKLAEEKARKYAQRLIEMEEDLRNKLAIELHDEIGQNLAVLNINNVVIRNSLPMEARKSFDASVEVAEGLVMEICSNVRNIMANLRPPVLDEYGLPAALQWQAEQLTKRIGIKISVQLEDPFPRLAADKEIVLFRIAQEALTNSAKYAEARNVIVALESYDGGVRLNVIDDGKGFVPESASKFQPGSGWGLTIMSERAELIGGRFYLYSKPGKGTTVTVDVPKDRP